MLDYRRIRTRGWGPRTARNCSLPVACFLLNASASRRAGRVDGVFADVPPSGCAGGGVPSRVFACAGTAKPIQLAVRH
jgi:hypothetical protein